MVVSLPLLGEYGLCSWASGISNTESGIILIYLSSPSSAGPAETFHVSKALIAALTSGQEHARTHAL